MTDGLGDLFTPLTPPTPNGAGPRKCSHRDRYLDPVSDERVCRRCGHRISAARSLAGRRARQRGNRAERAIAKRHQGERTGMFGGPDDVRVAGLFVIQSKSGASYWPRYFDHIWQWLSALHTGERVPKVIIGDGGPGRHARRLVIYMEPDDIALHGQNEP